MDGRRRALLSVPFGYASLHCEQGTPIPLANDLQLFNFRWQSLFKFGWQWTLVSLSNGYTPYVRAILGAILEHNAADADIMSQVRKSLNGTTNYKQPISESVLPTKRNWNII